MHVEDLLGVLHQLRLPVFESSLAAARRCLSAGVRAAWLTRASTKLMPFTQNMNFSLHLSCKGALLNTGAGFEPCGTLHVC